jgi:hypothetical protein
VEIISSECDPDRAGDEVALAMLDGPAGCLAFVSDLDALLRDIEQAEMPDYIHDREDDRARRRARILQHRNILVEGPDHWQTIETARRSQLRG